MKKIIHEGADRPVLQVTFDVPDNRKLLGRYKDAEDGVIATISHKKIMVSNRTAFADNIKRNYSEWLSVKDLV